MATSEGMHEGAEPGSFYADEPDGQDSLLDALGALREQRAAETTTDLALPGFAGRLWATFRLPAKPARTVQIVAFIMADHANALSESMALVAECTVGIYTASADAEEPIRDGETLARGFHHLPGGTDEMPVNFADGRLERVRDGALCPPRPQGREHTPETRVRALFGADALVVQAAMMISGWVTGGTDSKGALAGLSERFRNGDRGD